MLFTPAQLQASLLQNTCSDELDNAVELYNAGRSDAAHALLEQLAEKCPQLPQVQHNLGVIAGQAKNWPLAESRFRAAIANDSRSTMTMAHLQSMHEYQATLAYQNALRIKRKVTPPDLQMQRSELTNATYRTEIKTSLHTVATVDYELFAWWTAASDTDASAWLEHYTHGYPPQENNDAQAVDWQEVSRDISFTAQDAVVVLSYQNAGLDKRILLLLRLQDKRWKIYREVNL